MKRRKLDEIKLALKEGSCSFEKMLEDTDLQGKLVGDSNYNAAVCSHLYTEEFGKLHLQLYFGSYFKGRRDQCNVFDVLEEPHGVFVRIQVSKGRSWGCLDQVIRLTSSISVDNALSEPIKDTVDPPRVNWPVKLNGVGDELTAHDIALASFFWLTTFAKAILAH